MINTIDTIIEERFFVNAAKEFVLKNIIQLLLHDSSLCFVWWHGIYIRARWKIKIYIRFPYQVFIIVKLNFRNILFYDNNSFFDYFLRKFALLCYKGKSPKIQRKFPTFLKRVFLITHAFLSKMLFNRPPIIDPLFGGV